jgi:hypothetical protein
MTAAQEISQAFSEIEGDFGDTFIPAQGGKGIACRATLIRQGDEPMQGGAWEIYSATLWVRLAMLPILPAQGDVIQFRGQSLYAQMVSSQAGIPLVKIEIANTPAPK